MSDFQSDMNHAVRGFVAQIADLARRAALDTLESAFGSRGSGVEGRQFYSAGTEHRGEQVPGAGSQSALSARVRNRG